MLYSLLEWIGVVVVIVCEREVEKKSGEVVGGCCRCCCTRRFRSCRSATGWRSEFDQDRDRKGRNGAKRVWLLWMPQNYKLAVLSPHLLALFSFC